MSIIKRFKPAYSLYNLLQKERLSHNMEGYKSFGIKKKYFGSVSSSDFKGLDQTPTWLDAGDSSQLLPSHPDFGGLPEAIKPSLLDWSNNGYAIWPSFISPEKAESVNLEIEQLLGSGKVSWKYGNKIMFAFHESELIEGIGRNDQLLKILSMLLGVEARLFQSINFHHASQQRTHSDTIHMTTFPLGRMIACWVALEDMTETNGPLHYYPGSHKLPYLLNSDMDNEGSSLFLGKKGYNDYEDEIEKRVKDSGLAKKTFTCKKGDMLIWHANLLHGGEALLDSDATRKSMVFHYYGKGAICYHEITQRPALMPKG